MKKTPTSAIVAPIFKGHFLLKTFILPAHQAAHVSFIDFQLTLMTFKAIV